MQFSETDSKIFHSLAEQYGTPLYVYREEIIRKQYQALNCSLTGLKHLICYAVKANSNLSLLRLFNELGCGFDIVSEGELRRLVQCGIDPSHVVYSGVGKTESEIRFALKTKIKFFNVESASELSVVEKAARELNVIASIAFRINPDVDGGTHPHLATGLRTSKFGLSAKEALSLWSNVSNSNHLSLVGVDCHIGSHITDIVPLKSAYEQVLAVANEFKKLGAPIKYLDLGGGFAVSFSGHYTPLDLETFGRVVRSILGDTDCEVIFEPGKFLIAEAGLILTRVIYTKQNYENKFAVVDAGMNDLIRPSLYDAYHYIELLSKGTAVASTKESEIDIVGPVCETGCFLARNRLMPHLSQGDLLAVCDAGAYGMSMASNYNSRRLAAEVLLRPDGTHSLIRRRDSFEDLWQNELVES